MKKIKDKTKMVLDKTTVDDKIIYAASQVKREARKHIITAISGAFAFLIALAWRDAISAWINNVIESFHLSEGWYRLLGALIVTIIGVFGIIIASKFEEKPVENGKLSK